MKKILTSLTLLLIFTDIFGQSIKMGNFKDTLCPGEPFNISVTVTGGPLNNGNIYYVILSSNSGVFNTVDTIGTKASKTNATITATVKIGTIAGTGYKIRLVASQHSSLGDTSVSKTINILLGNNSITSSTTSICSGLVPNTIVGSDPTGGGGSYTYVWQSSIVSGTASFGATIGTGKSFSPSGLTSTTWYRRIVTSGPCARKDTSLSYKITVIPLPSATITGSVSVCLNSTMPNIILTGSGGTAPYTFTYNINSSSDITSKTKNGNTDTIKASTSVAGSFVYTLTMVSDSFCSQSQNKTITITVNPLPTAVIAGNATVCQNSTPPVISFTGSGGTAPYLFSYTKNGVPNTTSGNINASTSTPGTFIYILTSVSDGSASNCSQSQSGTVTIVVKPTPTATISGTVSVCQNDTLPNIILTGTGGTAPYTFTYHINSGSDITSKTTIGNTDTIKAPTAVAGSFTYFLTDVQDSFCSQTQNKNVKITVNPAPDISSNITSKTICSGMNTNLSLVAVPSSNFDWKVGTITGNISGAQDGSGTSINQILTNPNHTKEGNVIYNITSASSIGNCKAKFPITVTVNPIPLPPIIKTPLISGSSICKLTSNMNFQTDSLSQQTYQWNVSNAKINRGGNQHNCILSFPNEGNATISCITTLTINSISCSDTSEKTILVQPNTNNLCSEIALKPNKIGLVCLNNDVSSYEWGYDNKFSDSIGARNLGTSQDYNPSPMPIAANRAYWVMVYDVNKTCYSKSYYGEKCLTTDVQNTFYNQTSFNFLPNPVMNIGHIIFDQNETGKIEIIVNDAYGKQILNINKDIYSQNEIELDFNEVSNGVYFIQVYMNQIKYKSFKIIK